MIFKPYFFHNLCTLRSALNHATREPVGIAQARERHGSSNLRALCVSCGKNQHGKLGVLFVCVLGLIKFFIVMLFSMVKAENTHKKYLLSQSSPFLNSSSNPANNRALRSYRLLGFSKKKSI